jgi:hypothetical protein
MKSFFVFSLAFCFCTGNSFAGEVSTSGTTIYNKKNAIACKNVIISQHLLDKVNAVITKTETIDFPPYYFWILTSQDCWQLCVLYQENGQFVVSSANPPAAGGEYMGATQVCLDQNFNPGSQYNSFNNLC